MCPAACVGEAMAGTAWPEDSRARVAEVDDDEVDECVTWLDEV